MRRIIPASNWHMALAEAIESSDDGICPECEEQLDHLDLITNKITGETFNLWICHNEDCDAYGSIWNDRQGDLMPGDPSGIY